MNQAIQHYLQPLLTMNRRVSIGGGVLTLLLVSESALAFVRLFA